MHLPRTAGDRSPASGVKALSCHPDAAPFPFQEPLTGEAGGKEAGGLEPDNTRTRDRVMWPTQDTPSEDALPRLFAAQYAQFEEDLPLWVQLAEDFGGPVLELGCGPGRVLAPLLESGRMVVGIDQHLGMLQLAQRRLGEALSGGPLLVQADLRAFRLSAIFRLIIISCNTFSELDDPMAQSTLHRLRAHLAKDGCLAIDLPNPKSAEPSDEIEILMSYYDPIGQNPIQLSARQRASKTGAQVQVHWYYDELFPNGSVRRHETRTTYHLRGPEHMTHLLGEAGFRDSRIYGDYEFGGFSPDSDRMLVLSSPGEGVLKRGG